MQIMKRTKNAVRPNNHQKSISSFFYPVSCPTGPGTSSECVKNQESCRDEAQVFEGSVHSLKQSASHSRNPTPCKIRKVEDTCSPCDIVPATPPSSSPMKDNGQVSLDLLSKKKKQESIDCMSPLYTIPKGDAENGKQNLLDQGGKSRGPSSKRKTISPIKTEDDKILKNILDHISPVKCPVSKPDNLKICHVSVPTTHDFESDVKKHIAPKSEILSCNYSDAKIRGTASEKSMGSFSKRRGKKSIQLPPLAESVELKYPPLAVQTNVPRNKPCFVKPSEVEKSPSPFKQALQPEPSSASTVSSFSPLRRSPRKHWHPPESKNDQFQEHTQLMNEKEALSNLCEVNDKENTKASPSSPRRSPRKHACPFDVGKSLKKNDAKNQSVTDVTQVPLLNSALEKKGCSSNLDDLQAAFQSEHDDIVTFMANVSETELNPLDLSAPQLCEVISIFVESHSQEANMKVKGSENPNIASCMVRGCWLACPVSEGDRVSLQAVQVGGKWLLDSNHGFLVLYPDTLISGTTVVGSLFCARRSVLNSLFRGIDSDSPIMVTGSIVHELFQMVLQQKKCNEVDIRHLSEELLTSKRCMRMLYNANMSLNQIQKEISNFIPRIVDFVEKFVDFPKVKQSRRERTLKVPPSLSAPSSCKVPETSSRVKSASHWNGKIVGIRDIEETLWDPKLGMKGMVDVSVEVMDKNGTKKIMPLELKTGKASFSAEHRGQVTLYTMMMSRLDQSVKSGLLLYLREGQIQEVSVSHNERKDLVHLRNTLVHFLRLRVPSMGKGNNVFDPLNLPDPINFKSACEKCPYATLCSVHLQRDGFTDLASDHPMVALSSSTTKHLDHCHIDYFFHWVGLLLLEETDQLRSAKLRHIWRFPPEEREKGRQAISYLGLLDPPEESGGKFVHIFSRKIAPHNVILCDDLRETGLKAGDYVLISTESRLAVDHGSILNMDAVSVTVSTNKNLHNRYDGETFHLDSSESNTVLVFNLTNLGCLLDDNKSAERLRKIIIEKIPPTFSTKCDKDLIQDCLQVFRELNTNQRTALIKTLRADSYLLIKGLPGTGKTATMVALVQLLARAGLSILVTSHTHSAVDNLLLRVKDKGLKFLRLGADARIHPLLQSYSESSLTENCKTPEDLDKVLSEQQIVGVTCLGAAHACLSRRSFDICLVDESTQVLQPSILRPLFNARRFILVGDPEQLPPVVKCHQAQELGLSESLFARLDSDAATVSLTLNYRMNKTITDLANGLTYGGRLHCATETVAKATLKATKNQVHKKLWLSEALSTSIEKSVVFVDTCHFTGKIEDISTICTEEASVESTCCNKFELGVILQLLNAFVDAGINLDEIGVMAPYRAQVSLLMQSVKSISKLASVEVNTVDQFQGRDKEVILYSCTRSDGPSVQMPKDREILNDKRRLTVAITRAKHKLVLVGHSETLKLYKPFERLFSCLPDCNVISFSQ